MSAVVSELENNWDFLYFHDGETGAAAVIYEHTGMTDFPMVESTGNSMFVRFTSDGSVTEKGALMHYNRTL